MITGAHTILYAEDPVRARAFFRDVLGWPNVDAGNGWLIFKSPPAEIAMHPTADGTERHELWLMCDDVAATRRQLEERGVVFTTAISEARFGLITELEVPGAGRIGLYQPRHPTAV